MIDINLLWTQLDKAIVHANDTDAQTLRDLADLLRHLISAERSPDADAHYETCGSTKCPCYIAGSGRGLVP